MNNPKKSRDWDFEYFKNIGPLFNDDGENVDGKVKDFIKVELAKARKEGAKEALEQAIAIFKAIREDEVMTKNPIILELQVILDKLAEEEDEK